MSGEAANTGGDIGLDAKTGRATQSARTTYLALLTSAPSDTTTLGTMAELTTPGTNGYDRQSVTWSAPGSDGAGARETHNTGTITFGPFTSDLSNVTHCALVSASTGTTGDFIFFWALDSARDPASGDSISFAASALVMKED
jgi:hypothetical protein